MPNNPLAVLIVAAGSSSRLGQPKQLVKRNNSTLLEHSMKTAKSVSNDVYVVLGANYGQIVAQVEIDNPVYFQDWQSGMGSSIAFGVSAILANNPRVENVLIMVCDQPFVSPDLLRKLVEVHSKSDRQITACTYGNISGVPTLFSKAIFPELIKLSGDNGAKAIIAKHSDQVNLVPFPHGTEDIDTPQDLQRLTD